MGKVFTGIYNVFKKRPWVFLLFLILILGFESWYGSRIVLEEDINKVVPATEKNSKLIAVLENSKFTDRLLICISQNDLQADPDPKLLIAYAEALIDSLQQTDAKKYIREIEGRFSPVSFGGIYDALYQNLPVFLKDEDYDSITQKLGDSAIALSLKKDYEKCCARKKCLLAS